MHLKYITEQSLQDKIYTIREQKVMLDFELAEIYGYTTTRFNEQVKNNIEKFDDERLHSRFIVLDYNTADERVFLCGASSKDAGARVTSIVEDFGTGKYKALIDVLLKIQSLHLHNIQSRNLRL